jgi:hypothetical protein
MSLQLLLELGTLQYTIIESEKEDSNVQNTHSCDQGSERNSESGSRG